MLPTLYTTVGWETYVKGETWAGYTIARTVNPIDTRQEGLLELAKRILGDSKIAQLWLLEATEFGSKYTEQ